MGAASNCHNLQAIALSQEQVNPAPGKRNRTTGENAPNQMKGKAMTTSKDMGAGHFLVYFLVARTKTMW